MTKTKRIIVADDDPAILDVTRTILAEIGGYEVVITDKGEDLLRLAPPLPDLILLDIWMSGFSGQEICEQLKQEAATANIPIILFSANRELSLIAEQCGANDYLSKPFQLSELLAKVAQWV
jgi:CheY-like chemotaxis protein